MEERYECQIRSMDGWMNMQASGRAFSTVGAAKRNIESAWQHPEQYVWRIVDLNTGEVVDRGADRTE